MYVLNITVNVKLIFNAIVNLIMMVLISQIKIEKCPNWS